jgi:hypothetical protein
MDDKAIKIRAPALSIVRVFQVIRLRRQIREKLAAASIKAETTKTSRKLGRPSGALGETKFQIFCKKKQPKCPADNVWITNRGRPASGSAN